MYFLSQFFFFQRFNETSLFNRVMRIGSKHPVLKMPVFGKLSGFVVGVILGLAFVLQSSLLLAPHSTQHALLHSIPSATHNHMEARAKFLSSGGEAGSGGWAVVGVPPEPTIPPHASSETLAFNGGGGAGDSPTSSGDNRAFDAAFDAAHAIQAALHDAASAFTAATSTAAGDNDNDANDDDAAAAAAAAAKVSPSATSNAHGVGGARSGASGGDGSSSGLGLDTLLHRSHFNAFDHAERETSSSSSSSSSPGDVGLRWLLQLRGCHPLTQACDPSIHWATPWFDHDPQHHQLSKGATVASAQPWALTGVLDPKRDAVIMNPPSLFEDDEAPLPDRKEKGGSASVAGGAADSVKGRVEDPRIEDVPFEWVRELKARDLLQVLTQRKERTSERLEMEGREKKEEMGGAPPPRTSEESEEKGETVADASVATPVSAVPAVPAAGPAVSEGVREYLGLHGCSAHQASLLSQPYYSQVEAAVDTVMGAAAAADQERERERGQESGGSSGDSRSGVGKLTRKPVLTWTVTDGYAYADVLADMHAMVSRHGLGARFMFVALDKRAAAMACRLTPSPSVVLLDEATYPSLKKHASSRNEEVKAQVEEAKFGTAAKLASLEVDFFFLEMDVWLLRSPLPLFYTSSSSSRAAPSTNQLVSPTQPDVVISVHQENFMDLNAGFYFVRGNERSRTLFQGMLNHLLANPVVWDQSLMSCLMKRESSQAYLSNHAGCDRQGLTEHDLSASPHITSLNIPAKKKTQQNQQQNQNKQQHLSSGAESESASEAASTETNSSSTENRFSFAVLGPDTVVSAAFPYFFAHSVAVHVLTDKPLTSAHGKKLVAKELGLWEGAGGYYHVGPYRGPLPAPDPFPVADRPTAGGGAAVNTSGRTFGSGGVAGGHASLRGSLGGGGGGGGERGGGSAKFRTKRNRYLLYDGPVSTNSGYRFHDQKGFAAVLLHLVALALATGRTLVLPAGFDTQRQLVGWQALDVNALSALGVEWRETSFLFNPRLRLPTPLTISHAFVSASSVRLRSLDYSGAVGHGSSGGDDGGGGGGGGGGNDDGDGGGGSNSDNGGESSSSSSSGKKYHEKTQGVRVREVGYGLPKDGDRWPSLWAALSHKDSPAAESDLLFVLFDERGAGPRGEQLNEMRCFAGFDPTTGLWKDATTAKTAHAQDKEEEEEEEEEGGGGSKAKTRKDSGPWGCAKASDGVHPLLMELSRSLRWCLTRGSAAPRDWSKIPGLTPGSDCFTYLERQERNKARLARIAAEDKEKRSQHKREGKAAKNK